MSPKRFQHIDLIATWWLYVLPAILQLGQIEDYVSILRDKVMFINVRHVCVNV